MIEKSDSSQAASAVASAKPKPAVKDVPPGGRTSVDPGLVADFQQLGAGNQNICSCH